MNPAGTLGTAEPAGLGASSLILAALCAAAGGWLYWRNRRRQNGGAARGQLAIAETRSLGNRQYLVVAAYGEQRFLIGVCPGRLQLLADLPAGAKAPRP
jgi:flagellar protein FliO/FliZ